MRFVLDDLKRISNEEGLLDEIANNNVHLKDYKKMQEGKLEPNLNYDFNRSYGKRYLRSL